MVLELMLATGVAVGAGTIDRAGMIRIADVFDEAQLGRDRALLGAMADDELLFIAGSGQRSGKRAFIDGWTDADTRYEPIVLVDRTLPALSSDAFVASAETTLSGASGQGPLPSHLRFSDASRRRDGAWKAVHVQANRVGK